jgi:hypothetical protein
MIKKTSQCLNTLKTNYYYFYDVFYKNDDIYMIGPYYPILHFPTKFPVLSYNTDSNILVKISGEFIKDNELHTSLWKFSVKSQNQPPITGPVTLTYCMASCTINLEPERKKLKHNISISTTMKNEHQFLKQWLDFHIFSGVNHFYLYDNNSDNQVELQNILQPYICKGYVTLIHWDYPYRSIPGFPLLLDNVYYCSIVAINHCIHKYGQETDWLITMDVDEYLVPKVVDRIEDFVKVYKYSNISGIYIPDYVFGYNESEEPSLIKRFLTRSEYVSKWLNSGKVLLKPKDVLFCEVHIITRGGPMIIAHKDTISINHYHYYRTNCKGARPRNIQSNLQQHAIKDTRCLELLNKYTIQPNLQPNLQPNTQLDCKYTISIKDFGTWSRLGNQMFQYAYLRVLSQVHGFSIQLPRLKSPFGYDQAQLFDAFNLNIPDIPDNIKFDLVKETTIMYEEKLSTRNIYPTTNIMFDGYFQSDKYFSGFEDIIRKDFTFKINIREKGDKYLYPFSRINLIALHIRRGDNLREGSPTTVLTDSFIGKSIDYIRTKLKNKFRVLVFSDDKTWCKNNLNFLDKEVLEVLEVVEGLSDLEELYVMSKCNHFIISASTFSWWAAWLSTTESEKIVVAPNKWFNNNLAYEGISLSEQDNDIIPKNWIKL